MTKKRPKSRAARQPGDPRSPRSGTAPPAEHRWPKGKSGNEKGRPPAGATLREWLNALAQRGLTEAQLRRIARDRKAPWPKRAAAERALRAVESGDVADYDPFLGGQATLAELRRGGLDTRQVKKAKRRTRTFTDKDGGTETVVEAEVELHDRSGEEFDRIADRTEGRPTQRVHVQEDEPDEIRTPEQAERLLQKILKDLGADRAQQQP